MVAMGSSCGYSLRLVASLDLGAPTLARRDTPCAPMLRTVRAASISEASEMSSEQAVFSPDTARTPTPWSMLKLPVLTMPSSRLQPSARVLEVQIGFVHPVLGDVREHLVQVRLVQAEGFKQQAARCEQALDGGFT